MAAFTPVGWLLVFHQVQTIVGSVVFVITGKSLYAIVN